MALQDIQGLFLLHSDLLQDIQGKRKVILATNIAESYLTIDGISFVIDPGFAKQNVFDAKLGQDFLEISPISQASARQRAVLASRTGHGKCYCLYTQSAFQDEMHPTSIPEIQRSNLTTIILYLVALEQLYCFGALNEKRYLTELGSNMAAFPVEAQLSKMLLAGVDLGCDDKILTIITMYLIENVFYRPRKEQVVAD